jgi:hypothetical protein
LIEHYKDDISTIFSIVPFEIREFKPGLYPGSFNIPACLNDASPQILQVSASEHLMTVGGKKEPIRIITPSYQIANSIVIDFFDGQLWTTPEERPGICWIQGSIDIVLFKTKHLDMYDKMKLQQRKWFVRICKQTDNEWKKQQSYRVVSDQARFAAHSLGLDPEWLRAEEVGFTFNKCPACSTMNDPQNSVCSNCRCILNEEKYKKQTFAKAG